MLQSSIVPLLFLEMLSESKRLTFSRVYIPLQLFIVLYLTLHEVLPLLDQIILFSNRLVHLRLQLEDRVIYNQS